MGIPLSTVLKIPGFVPVDRNGIATTPTIAPAGLSEEAKAATVKQLIQEIAADWLHGRQRRLQLGSKLVQLHALLAHCGSGTFMKTVQAKPPEGCGIPYQTASDYMEEAREADSCYEIHNNSATPHPDGNAEEPTVSQVPTPAGGSAGTEVPPNTKVHDPGAEQVVAVKQNCQDKVEYLKRQSRFSLICRVDLQADTTTRRDELKNKVNELGNSAAFERCFAALCPEQDGTPTAPAEQQEVALEVVVD